MADTLKDIPEFFETELGESIAARTDALGKTTLTFYIMPLLQLSWHIFI